MPDDTDSIALAENIRIGIKKGRIIIGTKILFFAKPNVNAEPKIPIDIKTGEIIEFVDDEINQIQQKIAEKYGYTLVDHKLELYGIKKKSQ